MSRKAIYLPTYSAIFYIHFVIFYICLIRLIYIYIRLSQIFRDFLQLFVKRTFCPYGYITNGTYISKMYIQYKSDILSQYVLLFSYTCYGYWTTQGIVSICLCRLSCLLYFLPFTESGQGMILISTPLCVLPFLRLTLRGPRSFAHAVGSCNSITSARWLDNIRASEVIPSAQ